MKTLYRILGLTLLILSITATGYAFSLNGLNLSTEPIPEPIAVALLCLGLIKSFFNWMMK